nr:hypothetical protein [Tanacetum cinerariifolium]
MASSATTAPSIPVFLGTHYHIWAVKIKTYLKSQSLWKVVETDESTLAPGENPTVALLRTYVIESLKKDKALTCLHSGIADQIVTAIMDLETPKAVWDKLQETFEDDELVKDYSATMMDVVNQMRLHEEVVKDQKVVEKMMISVPPKFEAKISDIEEYCDLDTLTSLTSKKGTFPPCNICQNTNHQEANYWFKDKPNFKCNFCNKFRHLEKYCRVKKARNNTQGVQQENVFEEDHVDDEHLFMASDLDKHPDSLTWLMDSGCESHMTPERSLFLSLDTKDNPRVKMGEGRYTRAKRRGTIAINTKKGTKYISRVLYVPELDRTIFDMVNDSYYLKLDVADASAFSVSEDDSINEVDIPKFDIKDTNDTDVLRTRPLVDVYKSCNSVIEPESYMDASKHSEWIDAMKVELEMIKKKTHGSLSTCQMGKMQCVDFEDTFALVARHDTIKLLIAIAAQRNWKIYHLDVKSAFLNGELEEQIYVKQPEGFEQLPNGVHISQRKYASDMLNKFKMFLCKLVTSPLVYKFKLSKDDGKKLVNPARFRSIVGSLLYLTISRLNLSFAASFLSRFMGEPSSSHLGATKRKHINVKYHAIREAEKNEEVKLKYCTSETQLADMHTKLITRKKLNYFKAQIMKSNNNLKEEC